MSIIMTKLAIVFLIMFILFGIPGYYIWASGEKDALFFIRKGQFKRKLLKNGHENTWDFIDTLITTSENNWKKTTNHMYYEIFPGTTLWFRDYMWLELEIIEGSGEKKVFNVCYFDDSDKVKYGHDPITKKYLTEIDNFRMKRLLFHLKDIQDNLKNKAIQQEQEERRTAFETKETKKGQLLALLKQAYPLNEGVRRYGFSIALKNGKNYQVLLLSLEDTVYYQALQMDHTHEIHTTFHHQSEKQVKIFMECQTELDAFANRVLGQALQKIPSKQVEMFEKKFEHRLPSIYSLMTKLKEDEMWLSSESLHKINETFPHDLEVLRNTYETIRDKESVANVMAESLQIIEDKLRVYMEEAEGNKRNELEKRKLIIHKR